MRFRSFNSILDECLAAIQQGETVDECLARYPVHAERLERLLTLADKVRSTPPALPRPWRQAAAWQRVHQRPTDLRAEPKGVQFNLDYGAWLLPVAITLAGLLALFGATGRTVLAAQHSPAHAPLYRVMLASAAVRLLVVMD